MNIRKLNEIREVRNLSCVSIAEQSGVPYRTVSKLFSGENQNPTWETITAITRVLNCSLDELLNTHPSEIFRSEEIKRIRKFRSLSAHGKRMVDIVLENTTVFWSRCTARKKSMRLIWWMTSASSAMSRSPRRPAMCAH